MCHNKICIELCLEFEPIHFVSSYKKACCIPHLKDKISFKKVSKNLLNYYEGWLPLIVSVVVWYDFNSLKFTKCYGLYFTT